uniref:Uncharacterized protein LOC104242767 n=1 Tax=Nicotiana sylvestris TaxID=4096 RepID=A0A1U7YBI1_NICSY|nr:PREDICTED: uncharacterized protein LOC104242767 [Nicotiana sylvestris]
MKKKDLENMKTPKQVSWVIRKIFEARKWLTTGVKELELYAVKGNCDSCSFNLHVICASIPITLNQEMKYPLHLFFSFPITSEAATPFCSICAKAVPASGCWSLSVINRPPPTVASGEITVTHFTHRYALKKYNSDKTLSCNLCNFVFSRGYICSGCDHFIYSYCFTVPSNIQHMFHPQHPLKLTCYLDFQNENINCPGCQGDFSVGRAIEYYCACCKFHINRQCAGAPKTLYLGDNVSYELFFSFPFKHENAEIKCNICSQIVVTKDGLLYYNLERDEALHVYCALENESGYDEAKAYSMYLVRNRFTAMEFPRGVCFLESGYRGENNIAPSNKVSLADPNGAPVADPIDANSHVAIGANLPTKLENNIHGDPD